MDLVPLACEDEVTNVMHVLWHYISADICDGPDSSLLLLQMRVSVLCSILAL